MCGRILLSIFIIFIVWAGLDLLMHGMVLTEAYQQSAHLWRPLEEMRANMWKIESLTFAISIIFTVLYVALIRPKGLGPGTLYGLLFGLAGGASMGFGSYLAMPFSRYIAVVWFIGTLIECVLAGIIVGAIIKPSSKSCCAAEPAAQP